MSLERITCLEITQQKNANVCNKENTQLDATIDGLLKFQS